MADCILLNKRQIELAKKDFGENIYRLLAEYGNVENIPSYEKLPLLERARNFEELYKGIITKDFDEYTPFFEIAFKNLIVEKKDNNGETGVYYQNNFLNKFEKLNIIDIEDTDRQIGVIEKATGGYAPSERLKKIIIDDLKKADINPSKIVKGVYKLFGVIKKKETLEKRLKYLDNTITDLNQKIIVLIANGETDKANMLSETVKKTKNQRAAIIDEIDNLIQDETALFSSPDVIKAISIVDKETLYENLNEILDASAYEVIDVPNASGFLKDFVVLKNIETGYVVLLHPFAGRYDNRKTSIMGRYTLPKEIAKEADLYANTSNFINTKLYLASLELIGLGYKIEKSISANIISKHYDNDVPFITLDLVSFNNRINAVMEYILASLTDLAFSKSIQKAREKIYNPPQETDTEELDYFNARLKILKMPQEDIDEYLTLLKNGNYEEVLEMLLEIANQNKKKSSKEKKVAIAEMIGKIQSKDLSAELKEAIYDDPSISMWIKDANQIQNYWIQTVMDFVNKKLFITKRALLPFYTKVNEITEKIIKQFPDEVLKNRLNPFSDGEVFFDKLIAKESGYAGRYIYVNPNREGKWAKSQENKKGWNNLTQEEKEFSELFVSSIRDAYIGVYGEKSYEAKWEDGLIPIMKKKESLQIKQSLQNKNWDGIKEAFFRMHMFQNDFNQVMSEASQNGGVPNYYMYTNKNDHAEEYYKAIGDYGAVEHDLYTILLRTVANLEKKKNFDKIDGYFKIVRKLASTQTQDDGYTKNENTLRLLDAIYEKYWLQRNKKINTGNRKYNNEKVIRKILTKSGMSNVDIDNIFAAISKYSSMLTIALSPANDIKNFIQGFLRALSRGLAGTLNRAYGGDSPFTLDELMNGYKFVFSAIGDKEKRDLLYQLLKVGNMYQADVNDFANPRFKETDKRNYLFRSNAFYILNYLGDYANRAATAYAVINKQIGIDAYSLDKNGNLVYNEEKDKRYKTKEGRQILEYIKSQGAEYGIDYRMSMNMKRISNELLGSYDEETLRLIEQYSIGKLIMQFRRYLPDYLYESYAKGKFVRVNGNYKVIDGKVVWDGEYYEGIIRSMFSVINKRVLGRMEADANYKVSQRQQENMMKLASDILFLVGIYLLYIYLSGAGDDDDDKNKYGFFGNAKNKQRFYSMAFDFVQTINPNTFSAIINSPFAVGKTMNKINSVINNLWKASFFYVKGDEKKTKKYINGFEDGLFKITPYASSYYKFRADLEDILWDTSDVQYR